MPERLDFTLLAASVLTLIVLLGRHAGPWFEQHRVQARSLGGGLAAAYAFLTLLPEVEEGREVLGDWINALVLFGLLAYLSIVRWLEARETSTLASCPDRHRWARASSVVQESGPARAAG